MGHVMGSTGLGPDRWPRPQPKRLRVGATVAVYEVAIGFGIALFSGHIPGLGGHFTPNVILYGHEYFSEEYLLPVPPFGNNATPPASVSFHNVTFWLWITNWGSAYGTHVHGNGTEANGTSYSFVLAGLKTNQSSGMLYVSPDARFAAEWGGELFLQLLVEVPPAVTPATGSG